MSTEFGGIMSVEFQISKPKNHILANRMFWDTHYYWFQVFTVHKRRK